MAKILFLENKTHWHREEFSSASANSFMFQTFFKLASIHDVWNASAGV